MGIPCAIVGIDINASQWVDAISMAVKGGVIDLVATGQPFLNQARETGTIFDVPFYADLRRMLLETSPRIVIVDRSARISLDFIEALLSQGIGVFCIGPPVTSLTEAHRIAHILEPTTHLLYVWPKMTQSWAMRQSMQSNNLLKGPKFISAAFHAPGLMMGRKSISTECFVRNLLVPAWDAMHTLLDIAGAPSGLFGSLVGTPGDRDSFAAISGHAAGIARFLNSATASFTVSDRDPRWKRDLMVVSEDGTWVATDFSYHFFDNTGKSIEEDSISPVPIERMITDELELFCQHFSAPPSPSRGWPHLLTETASMLTAMLLSQRTGMAESPLHLRSLAS
ncbi:MAG: Gfo/Idh/MocA family oxidoreductase [Phycisphaerae bacterium]